jgi:hypothetical protein
MRRQLLIVGLAVMGGCGGKTNPLANSLASGVDAAVGAGPMSEAGESAPEAGLQDAPEDVAIMMAGQPGPECTTDKDCDALLGTLPSGCILCADGGNGCPHYLCISNICQMTFCASGSLTGSAECATPADCDSLLGPLPMFCIYDCPVTGRGCQHYICLSGICQTTFCK